MLRLGGAFFFFQSALIWPAEPPRLGAFKRSKLFPWVKVRPVCFHRGVGHVVADCEESIHLALSKSTANKRWLDEAEIFRSGLQPEECKKVRGHSEMSMP